MTRIFAASLAMTGVTFLIVGAFLGLVPIHAAGIYCGNVFHASEYGGNAFLGASICDGPRSAARLPAFGLLGVGVGELVIAGIVVAAAANERRQDAANDG